MAVKASATQLFINIYIYIFVECNKEIIGDLPNEAFHTIYNQAGSTKPEEGKLFNKGAWIGRNTAANMWVQVCTPYTFFT